MRAAVLASVLSVAVGQTISAATQTGFTNAMTACTQTSTAALQSNQACVSLFGNMGTYMGTTSASVAIDMSPLCGSTCFPIIRSTVVALGNCISAYMPTYVANLKADGVVNAEIYAASTSQGFNLFGDYLDFFCLKNERGQYCMASMFEMSTALSTVAANGSSVLDATCSSFYNMGCCLTSLGELTAKTANTSFVDSLSRTCPVLATYRPPACPGTGVRAVALSVSMGLTGLTCSAYQAQTDAFKAEYMAALKLDLASKGIDPAFITINTVTDSNGVCTVNVFLRAADDAATNALTTAAQTLNTASLTNSNAVLSTSASVGTVSALGTANVQSTYVSGPAGSAPSSGALAVPSMALLAAFLAWSA